MLEGAETPVVKGTRLASSWRKKNWWGESSCLPKWSKQIRSGCNPSLSYPLEQEFDDDAGEELELRQDKDETEVITCKVGPSLLATLKPTRMPSIALFLNLSAILLFSKMCESCVDQQLTTTTVYSIMKWFRSMLPTIGRAILGGQQHNNCLL